MKFSVLTEFPHISAVDLVGSPVISRFELFGVKILEKVSSAF